MQKNVQLPKDVTVMLDDLLRPAGESGRAGNWVKAIALCLEAWNVLPDPKEKWDFYPQIIARGLVSYYTAAEDIINVRNWIGITYNVYHDKKKEDIFVNILEGDSLFKVGLRDEAYRIFERVLLRQGSDWFQRHHPSYHDYYMKEKARHGA